MGVINDPGSRRFHIIIQWDEKNLINRSVGFSFLNPNWASFCFSSLFLKNLRLIQGSFFITAKETFHNYKVVARFIPNFSSSGADRWQRQRMNTVVDEQLQLLQWLINIHSVIISMIVYSDILYGTELSSVSRSMSVIFVVGERMASGERERVGEWGTTWCGFIWLFSGDPIPWQNPRDCDEMMISNCNTLWRPVIVYNIKRNCAEE